MRKAGESSYIISLAEADSSDAHVEKAHIHEAAVLNTESAVH